MAFPKAPIKRFNELSDDIPGVGSYNLFGDQQAPTPKGQKVTKDNELHAHIVSLKVKLKDAQERNKSLDNLLSGGNRQKEMLEKQCQMLRKELSLIKRNIESEENKLKKTISELQAEILELRSKGASAEQEHKTLLSQLVKERNVASALQIEQESLKSTIVKLKNELKETRSKSENKIAGLEEERGTIIKQLEEERNVSQESLKSTIVKLQNELKETISKSENKIVGLEEERNAIIKQLEEDRVVFEKESSGLRKTVLELQTELESVQTNLTKVVTELEETKVALENKLLQEESTAAVLLEKEREYSALQSVNATLQDHLRQVEEEKTNLLKTLSQLKEENIGLEQNQSLLVQKRDSLLSLLVVTEKSLTESQDEMSKLKVNVFNEKEKLRDALAAAQSTNGELVNKVSSLVAEMDNLRQELSNKTEETLKVAQARMHLETLSAGKEHQLAEYKVEVQALMQENEDIQTCLMQAQKDKQDLISQQEQMAASWLGQSESENWKIKFEELERKIEPFREALDMFELEKKILQARDKYTNEQMEKLTKEAIKNMGHQNHRQKVKYVDNLKKENLALHRKYQETHEELQRQLALVKKYKEKLDKPDCTKHYQTPCKARIPLKEGNKL